MHAERRGGRGDRASAGSVWRDGARQVLHCVLLHVKLQSADPRALAGHLPRGSRRNLYTRLQCDWRPRQCPSHLRQTVFFFFQAEDGIRDLTVTGVQTCALPISLCFPAKACPGADPDTNLPPARFLAHAFTNTTTRELCITTQLRHDCSTTQANALGDRKSVV